MTCDHVVAESDHVIDVEKVDHSRLSGHGCGRLPREVLAPVDHDDEMICAQGEGCRPTAHAGAKDDGDGATHAAIPVMPRAESMAGASALRSDS